MNFSKIKFSFIDVHRITSCYKNSKLQFDQKTNKLLSLKQNSLFHGLSLFKLNPNLNKVFQINKIRIPTHFYKWSALIGPGGGFLGVGTSELIVIGAVAWLVLGPKRLYQLAKDIGKISGEIKSVAEEAKQTFQQAVDLESVNSTITVKPKINKGDNIKPELNVSKKKQIVPNLEELVQKEIKDLEKN